MKLSFSLNKSKPDVATASLKRPAVFGSVEDEDSIDAAPTASSTPDHNLLANKKHIAYNVESSKAARKRMAANKKVDATVYEYDEVWDKIQEAKLRQKETKEADSRERKPKYIRGLLEAAATRKLDHLRAEDKMMQLEREAEGGEFDDKEAFVTQAYKDQMAEVRKAEEEEKKREEMQKKKGVPTSGMALFYQKLLEESEQKHEATVAATQKPIIGPQGPTPNLTISKPANFSAKSDLELAQIARAQGKDVELNDDNQIVDKRELLAAGLNLSTPNTRRLGLRDASGKPTSTPGQDTQVHRAIGTAASRKEINERRARDIQEQMEAERERLAKEKEKTDREAVQRTVARRNNQDDIQSARERYLQRKRQKLETIQDHDSEEL